MTMLRNTKHIHTETVVGTRVATIKSYTITIPKSDKRIADLFSANHTPPKAMHKQTVLKFKKRYTHGTLARV